MMLGLDVATMSPDNSAGMHPDVIALISSSSESHGGSSSSYTSSSGNTDEAASSSGNTDEATSNRSGPGADATEDATDATTTDSWSHRSGAVCSICHDCSCGELHSCCDGRSDGATGGTRAASGSGCQPAGNAATAAAASAGNAATASQLLGSYEHELEHSAESLPPLSGTPSESRSRRLGPVLALLLLAVPLGGLMYGGSYLAHQASGPASEIWGALQPSSCLAFSSKNSIGSIGRTAASPLLSLHSAAAAAGSRVHSAGSAGRALLRSLQLKPKPAVHAPGSAAGGASSTRSRYAAQIFPSPLPGSAPGRTAAPAAKPSQQKHEHGRPAAASSPSPVSGRGSGAGGAGDALIPGAAGSGGASVAAAVAQLQAQVAALHDEVAVLRQQLLGLPGNPAAEEGAAERAAALLRAMDSLTAAVASRQGLLEEAAADQPQGSEFTAGRRLWDAASGAVAAAGRMLGRSR